MSTSTRSEETDLRIRRSRQWLHDALIGLIEEKSYDEISITDITERANLSRNTFYLHYKSKEELLASIIGNFIEDSIFQIDSKHIAKILQTDKVRLDEYLANHPHFETMFQLAKQQPTLMQLALCHLGVGLHEKFEECLAPFTNQVMGYLDVSEEVKNELKLILTFVNGGMLALLAKGVQDGNDYELDKLEKLSLQITNTVIREAIINRK